MHGKGWVKKENAFRADLYKKMSLLRRKGEQGNRKEAYDWLMELDTSPIKSFDIKACLDWFFKLIRDQEPLRDLDYCYWEAFWMAQLTIMDPSHWIKNHGTITEAVRRGELDIRPALRSSMRKNFGEENIQI